MSSPPTFKTSIDVLEMIKKLGGIGYIAHIDTSDIFKDEHLSGAFKQKLMMNNALNVIGISNREKKQFIEDKVKRLRKREVAFVLDCDSHEIDTLGRNKFWIKGEQINFQMVKKAIRDYSISIELNKPILPNKYIKNISVWPGQEGFLCAKNNNKGNFSLNFSESLNCFIGGRGTGKSTVINLLEFVLRGQYRNNVNLEHLCKNDCVSVNYVDEGQEYLVIFLKPEARIGNNDLSAIFNPDRDTYRYLNDKESIYKEDVYAQLMSKMIYLRYTKLEDYQTLNL